MYTVECNINVKYNILMNSDTFFDLITQFLHNYGLIFLIK